MADGLFDFFSRARGQERRAALEGLLTQFIPPEPRPQLGLLAEATPTRAAELSGQAAGRMVQPGLTGWERMAAAGDMASNMAGVLAPVAAGRAVGMAPVQAIEEAFTGLSMSPQMMAARDFGADEFGGFRVFHGSPHDFDKFSMDKIGTGEGAQAYGHGLYFADSEGVARSYRDSLARPYYEMPDGAIVADKYGADVVDAFENVGGDPAEINDTIQRLRRSVARDLQEFGVASVSELRPQYDGDLASSVISAARRADGLEALLKSGGVKRVNEGRMYEVNINADPEDFLDWDLPLSQQPAKVREVLGPRVEALRQAGAGLPQDPIGEALWRVAHPQGGFDKTDFSRSVPEQATERLREAGVPGIRYLDAGSRSFTPTTIKDTPSGSELYWGNDPVPVDVFPTRQAAEEAAKQFDTRSRNYVIFDENLIEIVRKYGIAGAAAMLGLSQADVAQALEQQQQPQASGLLGGPQ